MVSSYLGRWIGLSLFPPLFLGYSCLNQFTSEVGAQFGSIPCSENIFFDEVALHLFDGLTVAGVHTRSAGGSALLPPLSSSHESTNSRQEQGAAQPPARRMGLVAAVFLCTPTVCINVSEGSC